MLTIYKEMLSIMELAFRDFEAALPPAKQVAVANGWVYRFQKTDLHHAIVMKLALIQSTLRAAMLLLQNGYVAQQAMLQRIVDEANEDVTFLVLAYTNDKLMPLHEEYLAAFWAEEFGDSSKPIQTHQSRSMVSRQKIRAFIAQTDGNENPSGAIDATKVISKVYSGFIHGAAPHIMESYGGSPPKFHLHGMLGTPRIEEYSRDLWNYVYRGFLSHILVAKCFNAEAHAETLINHKKRFERLMGKQY